jgi:hypothetical protein
LSPNEQWLWIDFDAVTHDVEPILFRHQSGTKFENITDFSGAQDQLGKCYSYESARLFAWKNEGLSLLT